MPGGGVRHHVARHAALVGDQHVTVLRLDDLLDRVVPQTVVLEQMLEHLAVVAGDAAAKGAEPHVASPVLGDGIDDIVRQAVRGRQRRPRLVVVATHTTAPGAGPHVSVPSTTGPDAHLRLCSFSGPPWAPAPSSF